MSEEIPFKRASIVIPDPQIIEMEALDNAFYDWLNNQPKDDDAEYWVEQWVNIDRNALVFTSSDMEPADAEDEFYGSSMDLAMANDMHERIEAKRRLIAIINDE